MNKLIPIFMATFSVMAACATEQVDQWYTQGKFKPSERIVYTLENSLDINRENCPVIIERQGFPLPDLHEMWVTVVDPALPSSPAPSAERLALQGGHELREETHGHAIFHQLDDLDKDGVWDELYFQTNIKAKEKKTIFIYIGENTRGWNKHFTHANIGSYCRHQMPFWESENVGWKIWFANCLDVYAKRKPALMSNQLYMQNYDGYGVSLVNKDWGSDIQSVAGTFGGGAICLFEDPETPERVSMPRYTPAKLEQAPRSLWNAGQLSDTRYAYEVVTNGPLRSTIKIKGMNWDTGDGIYEYEQFYTAHAKQSYCTSRVNFTTYQPRGAGVKMGCGIRKKPGEDNFIQEKGIIVTSGPEEIRDPEHIDDRKEYIVDFIGGAVVVREEYRPEYQFVPTHGGNHTFKIQPGNQPAFKYMLFAAWSEGPVYNNKDDFNAYVLKTAKEYNHPVKSEFVDIEESTQE